MQQRDIGRLIGERTAELGSVEQGLASARREILCRQERLTDCIDIFPAGNSHKAYGMLCRCRGMIQEINPEAGLFPVSRSNFFGAALEDHEGLLDAVLLYVIPVPGNTHFYCLTELETKASPAGPADAPLTQNTTGHRKRSHEVELPSPTPEDQRQYSPRNESYSQSHAPVAEGRAGKDTVGSPAREYLNLPYPPADSRLNTACIVIIPTEDASRLRSELTINDIIDFYGFLELPDLAQPVDPEDEFSAFGMWHAFGLSTALVPRLICVAYERVRVPLAYSPADASLQTARERSTHYLRDTICAGDSLAAEYLLLHLCAKVGAHNAMTPVGDLPLLIRSPQLVAWQWSEGIAQIAPVAEIYLDAAVLSSGRSLMPRHNTDYLCTGALQVGNGTHFTVNCDGIDGVLESDSKRDEELFSAIHKQTLMVDYTFLNVDLPVDLSFLAVSTSEGAVHGLFNFATHVIWRPESLACPPPCGDRSESKAVREFIDVVRSITPAFKNAEGLQDKLTNALGTLSDHYHWWNNNDSVIHNHSFSAAMALMRVYAATRGRSDIQESDIANIVRLESERAARLQSPSSGRHTSSP